MAMLFATRNLTSFAACRNTASRRCPALAYQASLSPLSVQISCVASNSLTWSSGPEDVPVSARLFRSPPEVDAFPNSDKPTLLEQLQILNSSNAAALANATPGTTDTEDISNVKFLIKKLTRPAVIGYISIILMAIAIIVAGLLTSTETKLCTPHDCKRMKIWCSQRRLFVENYSNSTIHAVDEPTSPNKALYPLGPRPGSVQQRRVPELSSAQTRRLARPRSGLALRLGPAHARLVAAARGSRVEEVEPVPRCGGGSSLRSASRRMSTKGGFPPGPDRGASTCSGRGVACAAPCIGTARPGERLVPKPLCTRAREKGDVGSSLSTRCAPLPGCSRAHERTGSLSAERAGLCCCFAVQVSGGAWHPQPSAQIPRAIRSGCWRAGGLGSVRPGPAQGRRWPRRFRGRRPRRRRKQLSAAAPDLPRPSTRHPAPSACRRRVVTAAAGGRVRATRARFVLR
ncbi:unnamed protein product [Diplocarpon coronariae]